MNHKGIIKIGTAVLFLLLITPVIFAASSNGDVNQDGRIDAADLSLLAQQLSGSQAPVPAGYFLTGDCNRDRSMNALDLILLQQLLAGNISSIRAPGDVWATDPIVQNLRYVPAGTFWQGALPGDWCADSTPFPHTLTHNLAVMETEVTNGMWKTLRDADPASFPLDPPSNWTADDLPVDEVTWFQAMLFANRLSQYRGLTPCYQYREDGSEIPVTCANFSAGRVVYCDWDADGFRLPSEGEWEYCCRAGTTTPFCIDEPAFIRCGTACTDHLPELENVAWLCSNAGGGTHPAGEKRANPWNLLDIHGNVGEWCWDWFDAYPAAGQTDYRGPVEAPAAGTRVLRGGCWFFQADYARSAFRIGFQPVYVYAIQGFRLVRNIGG